MKATVFEYWAARAAQFDDPPRHGIHSPDQERAWLDRLGAWAGPAPVDALDVGCGTGFLSLLLARLGHRVVGIDAVDEMLDLARRKAAAAGLRPDLRKGDAEHLPFPEASFDLVMERHVIWTLPDPAGALREWWRVLRPGGRIVLIEGHSGADPYAAHPGVPEALPLYGGRPPERLADFVAESGLGGTYAIQIEPLMDRVLWGEDVPRERYALHLRRPR